MLGRTATRAAEAPADTPSTPSRAPRPSLGTFAERKAAREATGTAGGRPIAIVSLGFDKKLFKDRHSRDIWLDVELGVDWNNRNHRYYRQDGDTLWTPLFDDSGKTETVEKLGTIIDKGERFATTTYRPAEPEPAPRPV